MENLLNENNLQKGMHFWHTKKSWPNDFHNEFYQQLHFLKLGGLNATWWQIIVDHLSRWKAIRPRKKEFVLARGKEYLDQLQAEYERIKTIVSDETSSFSELSWEDLAGLYGVAFKIKNVNSPVFGSKLCHFIMPDAFPVIDMDAVGIGTQSYKDYWQFCKALWIGCAAQSELVVMMKQVIGSNVIEHYPYAVKITELCIIGNNSAAKLLFNTYRH